jgi:cytochrome c oxidase assembly protein subunit 15
VLRLLDASTVTAHLITALCLVGLLSAMHQACATARRQSAASLPMWWLPLPALTSVALLTQCALGGTMASRWAAEQCLASGEGCSWLLFHRLGAWPAALTIVAMAVGSLALPTGHRALRWFSGSALVLVAIQILLGVSTLRHELTVPGLTVAHQLIAALLVGLVGAVLGRSLSHPRSTSLLSSTPQSHHG